LDINSLGSVLAGVTRQGSDQVVVHFQQPAVPYFYYLADQLPIVPQHIWSGLADPVRYLDRDPVGTGAYRVQKCGPQNITYTANPQYWQPGLPKVRTVQYPAFTSNLPANNYLATGKAQWGGQFIPDIEAAFASKSPDHHYWFPPVANVALFPNLRTAALGDVQVRRALAYATDRQNASLVGEYGYEPPASQTGIVTPTFADWLDPAVQAQDTYRYDPVQAGRILEADGYRRGSDGIYAKDGHPLSFTVINQGGYSDWVAALQILQQGLRTAGIRLTVANLSANDYYDKLFNGNFDLAYYAETGGPAPYYELRQWLYSGNTAPIGQPAATNVERYVDPATDALLNSYGATTDPGEQRRITAELQQVMLRDVPVIPVTQSVNWYQYNTCCFTGWVTPQDPYALPSAGQFPDLGQVLLHLRPK
jgi:peptide/nickel transport system substrate-binding protein